MIARRQVGVPTHLALAAAAYLTSSQHSHPYSVRIDVMRFTCIRYALLLRCLRRG